jgi:chaperonin GroEL
MTRVVFSRDARKRLFVGLTIAAEAVSCTLGPKGKTVLIQRSVENSPIVTKDGVTVSRSINLKSPIERMGAQLVQEAASQTNDVAGDGTTTATVLTHAMVSAGLTFLEAGYDAKELCAGIDRARLEVDAALVGMCKRLTTTEEIAQVATISANGDAVIGDLIASAMAKVGHDGIITVEDAKGMTTSFDVAEGMQFDRGYLSPYFVTNNDRMNACYVDSYVLVTDKKLSNIRDLVPLLEQVVQAQKGLLIIADDVEGDALQGLVLNRVKSNLPVVAIKAPGYGEHRNELFRDICTLTGAKLVSSSTGVGLSDAFKACGKVKKFIVDAKSTTLIANPDVAANVAAHVDELKTHLEDVTLTSEEVNKLKIRIAKLASGVAVIKVGGATEVEMIERKYRIEDALNATRAAADEGIVSGGGVALLMAAKSLTFSATDMGAQVIKRACEAPLRRIVTNAGDSADVIINELEKRPTQGYNAATGEYVDMIAVGVIDPIKVTRTALKNAASVATTFLSLDAVVIEDDETSLAKD